MFFLFFYYIFHIFFNKMSNIFYINIILKKINFYIIKVLNYISILLSKFWIFPFFLLKYFFWLIFSLFFVQVVLKFNKLLSIVLEYFFSFKIKHSFFLFEEFKYDPYVILKTIDFVFFYPVFYFYYYFFNDLLFSFQKIYYWFIFKINNFGVSQIIRGNFFRYWSQGVKYAPAKRRSRVGFYNHYGISKFLRKSIKTAVENFPFIPNLHYYIFFLFFLICLAYLIYRVVAKDLKPIRYDSDDEIRFDLLQSIADQGLKIEFNEDTTDKWENEVNTKLKKYPLNYVDQDDTSLYINTMDNEIQNDEELEDENETITPQINSFDLIMNKFGIDGFSYLDEIKNVERSSSSNSFSYFQFGVYFVFDFLDILTTSIKSFLKYEVFSLENKFLVFSFPDHLLKNKKKNDMNLFTRIYYVFFLTFLIFHYIYLFIVIFTFFFLIIDAEFILLCTTAIHTPYKINMQTWLFLAS